MHVHACVHVQRYSLLGTIPLRENDGMTFDLWNIIAREHCMCSGASASIEKLHTCTCIYMHVYVCMYMLYYGGEWGTGYTRVVSFDRARGRSPSGLSKLTTSVNGVDHKHSAIV